MAEEFSTEMVTRCLDRLRGTGDLAILLRLVAGMRDLQQRELLGLLSTRPVTSADDVCRFAYLQGHVYGLTQVYAQLEAAATRPS